MDDAPDEEGKEQGTSEHDVQKSGQEENTSEKTKTGEKVADASMPYPDVERFLKKSSIEFTKKKKIISVCIRSLFLKKTKLHDTMQINVDNITF